jgi:hypothetical protein
MEVLGEGGWRPGPRAAHRALTVVPMGRKRWIVVGMDFSDGAIRALEYALENAKDVGASVACVHAYASG